MKVRELITSARHQLSDFRQRYRQVPHLRRLTTLTLAAACIFVAAGIYSLSRRSQPPPPDDINQVAPDQPMAEDEPPPPSGGFPSDRLNLTNWKIALPIDTEHSGSPDEIEQPEITDFERKPYFMVNPDGRGVIFRAYASGATTENSDYPRSELREMTDDGLEEASWSNESGTHSMTVREAITHLPAQKSEVVAAQVHDGENDVVMVRLEENRLFVQADGENIGDLDTNYQLGTPYTVTITAEDSEIRVYYNGQLKVTHEASDDGYYFKAGCYTQTNTDRGDAADAYGEVIIYDLDVSHR